MPLSLSISATFVFSISWQDKWNKRQFTLLTVTLLFVFWFGISFPFLSNWEAEHTWRLFLSLIKNTEYTKISGSLISPLHLLRMEWSTSACIQILKFLTISLLLHHWALNEAKVWNFPLFHLSFFFSPSHPWLLSCVVPGEAPRENISVLLTLSWLLPCQPSLSGGPRPGSALWGTHVHNNLTPAGHLLPGIAIPKLPLWISLFTSV